MDGRDNGRGRAQPEDEYDASYAEVVEVMMQDLGTSRREIVSTQDDRSRAAAATAYHKRLLDARKLSHEPGTAEYNDAHDPEKAERKNAWKTFSAPADPDAEELDDLDHGQSHRLNRLLMEQRNGFEASRGARAGFGSGRGGLDSGRGGLGSAGRGAFSSGRGGSSTSGRGGFAAARGGFAPQADSTPSRFEFHANTGHISNDARVQTSRHQAPYRGLSSAPLTLGNHTVTYPGMTKASPPKVAGSGIANNAIASPESQHKMVLRSHVSSAKSHQSNPARGVQQPAGGSASTTRAKEPAQLESQSGPSTVQNTQAAISQPMHNAPSNVSSPVRPAQARPPISTPQQINQHLAPRARESTNATPLADASLFLKARDSVFQSGLHAAVALTGGKPVVTSVASTTSASGTTTVAAIIPESSSPTSMHSMPNRRPSVVSVSSTTTSRSRPVRPPVPLVEPATWLQRRDRLFGGEKSSSNDTVTVKSSSVQTSPSALFAQPVAPMTPAKLFTADRAAALAPAPVSNVSNAATKNSGIAGGEKNVARPLQPTLQVSAATLPPAVPHVTTTNITSTQQAATLIRADSVLGRNEVLISLCNEGESEAIPSKPSAQDDLLGLTFGAQKLQVGLSGSRWAN